jgi:hypothetical protein
MPFLAVQVCCLLIVVSYYVYPDMKAWLDVLAAWNKAGGWVAAGFTAAVAGGLLPELVKVAMPSRDALRQHLNDACFNFGFFFVNGILVNLFYRQQTVWWGDGVDVRTIAVKIVVDQLGFNPLVAMPYAAVAFAWRRGGYRLGNLSKTLDRRFVSHSILPIMLPAWCFWSPALVFIYALPASLQYVLFLLALAAWSILMTFIAGRRHEPVVGG